MTYVEQAVFTSARTNRSAGYQVVARSPGVCEADVRELAVWGPSHDSLLELGPDAVSLNFHPLPSGACCISRTAPAGWEFSGRGGYRVYTQCLIVPPDLLGQFANNPFALIRAATAGGLLVVYDRVPERLEPLRLGGRASEVDQDLLARLATNPGPKRLATLVQTSLDADRVAVCGQPSAGELIAGMFSCLPVECRTEFSFSTGLKYSSRRPFRIMALSGDPAEQRWVSHQPQVTVLDLSEAPLPEAAPLDGWAQLIGRALASGRTCFLAAKLSKRRPHLSPEDLPALGLQLLEDLEASTFGDECRGPTSSSPPAREQETPTPCGWSGDAAHGSEGLQRADGAHRRFRKSPGAAATAKLKSAAPSRLINPASLEVLAKLEHLDDVVYEAIDGRATALEEFRTLWPQLRQELDAELLVESREQYLRYALTIWEECVEAGRIRNPSRAVQALDVLCALFDDT